MTLDTMGLEINQNLAKCMKLGIIWTLTEWVQLKSIDPKLVSLYTYGSVSIIVNAVEVTSGPCKIEFGKMQKLQQ